MSFAIRTWYVPCRCRSDFTPPAVTFQHSGFLRTSLLGQVAFFVSAWGFATAYLASSVFALATMLVSSLWWVGICIIPAEICVLIAMKLANGELASGGIQVKSTGLMIFGHALIYVIMAACPWFQVRVRLGVCTRS